MSILVGYNDLPKEISRQIENVPEELSYLPRLAMKIWFEDEEHVLPEKDLNKLRDYLVGEIKS
ncbi:MAG: hypothetical protein ACI4JA_06380 [Oscillospiraceae bacterium]